MKRQMTDRPFIDSERPEVFEFMKRISPVSELIWGWEAGRYVDWRWGWRALKQNEEPTWFADNCHVFYEGDEVSSLAVSEYGGKDVAILTADRDPLLVSHVLDWLLSTWAKERNGLSFEFSYCEYWLSSIFENAGCTEDRNTGHEWEYDLALTPETSPLPEGYRLETLAEGGDDALPGIAEVLKSAFNQEASIETSIAVLRIRQQNPLFLPELSVYTRSPQGVIASYCRGTVNPENGIACIDPVCSHSEFTKQGLAKAAVQECFRRLAAMGGKLCYIGSAPMPAPSTYLYRSLGPRRYTTYSRWNMSI